jgi:hypothetical protein
MSVASPGAMAIQMTLLTSRATGVGGNEVPNTLPNIKFARSKTIDEEESDIDLPAVERMRKRRESAKTLPNMFRRMSSSVMSTVSTIVFRRIYTIEIFAVFEFPAHHFPVVIRGAMSCSSICWSCF